MLAALNAARRRVIDNRAYQAEALSVYWIEVHL